MAKLVELDRRERRSNRQAMMMTTRNTAISAAVLALALVAGSAAAQKPGAAAPSGDSVDRLLSRSVTSSTASPPVVNDGEAYHRAEDAQQDPAELRTTRALNDETVSRSQLADNQDRADQAAYEAERAKYEKVVAQATQERLAYEQDVRQSEVAQRQWQEARDRWEADVRACEAGDRSRCAAPRR